jgi:hypothetical protein
VIQLLSDQFLSPNVMAWEASRGAAIVTCPYSASGPLQLSLIAGDHFEVFDRCGGWFHGRHCWSRQEGILPASCVAFYEMKRFDERPLFFKPQSLLHREARLTLRAALDRYQRLDSFTHIKSYSTAILGLTQLLIRTESDPITDSDAIRRLARAVDDMRRLLGFAPVQRTDLYQLETFLTWGKKHFLAPEKRSEGPQFVTLRFEISTEQLKTPVLSRIGLYDVVKKSWATRSFSEVLVPEVPVCRFVVHFRDKADIPANIVLVIYTYEMLVARLLISVGFVELPSAVIFNGPTIRLHVQSFDSSSPTLSQGLHRALIEKDVTAMKTIRSSWPGYSVEFTPLFGTISAFRSRFGDSSYGIGRLPNSEGSLLFATLVGIVQHSTKNSVLVVRLLDRQKGIFLPFFETMRSELMNGDAWTSALFRGVRDEFCWLNEHFAIDLLPATGGLANLFVVVELRRIVTSDEPAINSSHAVIPITSAVGSLRPSGRRTAPLHRFAQKKSGHVVSAFVFNVSSPPVGEITYELDFVSTQATACESLHKLLKFHTFPSDLDAAIKTFFDCGAVEWVGFSKE